MRILGIDPGIATMGYGVIDKIGNSLKHITHGVITTKKDLELSERIFQLYNELTQIIKDYEPNTMAVEELFFSKNTKTALTVAQARGCILLVGEQFNLKPAPYNPLQIKSSVCGYGKAEKKQVQYMVHKLLNLEKIPRPDDAADALGAAICHAHYAKISAYM